MHETEMSNQLKAPASKTWLGSVPLFRKCDGPTGCCGHREKQKISLPARNLITVVQAHSQLPY